MVLTIIIDSNNYPISPSLILIIYPLERPSLPFLPLSLPKKKNSSLLLPPISFFHSLYSCGWSAASEESKLYCALTELKMAHVLLLLGNVILILISLSSFSTSFLSLLASLSSPSCQSSPSSCLSFLLPHSHIHYLHDFVCLHGKPNMKDDGWICYNSHCSEFISHSLTFHYYNFFIIISPPHSFHNHNYPTIILMAYQYQVILTSLTTRFYLHVMMKW